MCGRADSALIAFPFGHFAGVLILSDSSRRQFLSHNPSMQRDRLSSFPFLILSCYQLSERAKVFFRSESGCFPIESHHP